MIFDAPTGMEVEPNFHSNDHSSNGQRRAVVLRVSARLDAMLHAMLNRQFRVRARPKALTIHYDPCDPETAVPGPQQYGPSRPSTMT